MDWFFELVTRMVLRNYMIFFPLFSIQFIKTLLRKKLHFLGPFIFGVNTLTFLIFSFIFPGSDMSMMVANGLIATMICLIGLGFGMLIRFLIKEIGKDN